MAALRARLFINMQFVARQKAAALLHIILESKGRGESMSRFCVEVGGVEGKGRVSAPSRQIQTFKVRLA